MFVDPCITVQFTNKNQTRCNNVSKCYYSIIIRSSTCFGRHTAHHQEPKSALAASGFSYVAGCWTCSWTLSGTVCLTMSTNYTSNNLTRIKSRGRQCSFGLLMMGGVSSETCWVSYKYGIIKFRYIVASCWSFIYELIAECKSVTVTWEFHFDWHNRPRCQFRHKNLSCGLAVCGRKS